MISSSDYNSIMREYGELQRRGRAERDARVEEVYSKLPRVRELDESRGSIAMQLVRQGGDPAQAFEKIRKEKEELLKAAGFPADYMELRYVCSDCKDTGYTEGQKCHCLKAREIKILYAQSHVDRILESENFATLDQAVYSEPEHMAKVVRYCKEYAEDFAADEKRHKENVVFTGNTGVGKTFLCNCIARELMDNNHSVIYLTSIELFDAMARAKIHSDPAMKSLYDKMLECELLVIDDLGSELNNSLTNSNLFFIINHRLQKRLATIISTNLNMEQIRENYSERVSSRIKSSYDIIPLIGSDIRLR